MAQSVKELKERAGNVELWPMSTNEDICGNCRFYRALFDDAERAIGYCAHREVDMVVGGPWWCKLWAPDRATEQARAGAAQT
jgi:hypothetical protein